MYRKDYLQRQFETFGKVVALLMSRRKNKELESYEKEFLTAFTTYFPFLPERIEALNQEEFEKLISTESKFPTEQKRFLADLIYEKMNLYLEIGKSQAAKTMALKSAFLYSLIQEELTENEFNLEVHYRLNFLKKLEDET